MRAEVRTLMTESTTVKPGWRTSEFWLSVTPMAVMLVLLVLGRITPDDISSLWPVFIPAGGYGISRGFVK